MQCSLKATISDRQHFIGGSDARVIMGGDETALIRLWQEKRGEAEPADLSGELVVQLGLVTEELNRSWYERKSGHRVGQRQARKFHPSIVWMAATLDGLVEQTGAVFEAKFMLPWSFSEEAAAQKHMAQLQHNMMVVGSKNSVLSIITGGGKWVEMAISADPVYQTAMMYAERAFWRAVSSGEPPSLFHAEPPRARDRGGQDRRYEHLERLGGVCCAVPQHPAGLSRARTIKDRTQDADAGRSQRGHRPRHSGQAIQIRGGELRSLGDGRCRALASPWRHWPAPWPRPRPS